MGTTTLNNLSSSLLKYMVKMANEKDIDSFTVWVAEKLIFPYKKEDKVLEWISGQIGFKKLPTIDKIYFKLKTLKY